MAEPIDIEELRTLAAVAYSSYGLTRSAKVMKDAADEIERLRSANDEFRPGTAPRILDLNVGDVVRYAWDTTGDCWIDTRACEYVVVRRAGDAGDRA